MLKTIDTMAGVTELGQPAGRLEVSQAEGDTLIEFVARDGQGGRIALYLDARDATEVMVALGAAISRI